MERTLYPAVESDAAARHEDWGSLQWLASERIGNTSGLTLGRVVIKKGQSNPRHAHFNCEEILYLLSGKLEHTLGNERMLMEAGDTIAVPAGEYHHAINVGEEDADMIVAYSSANRDFVLEDEAPDADRV